MDDKDFDKDLDYDLLLKYGIDLKADLTDEEIDALVRSESQDVQERPLKTMQPPKTERPVIQDSPVKPDRLSEETRPVRSVEPAKSEKAPEETAEKKDDNRVRMELYDWIQCVVSAILCGILIFVFVGRVIGVDGYSMLQTLHDQDKVIMTGLFYTPHYGDIVVIKTDAFGDEPIVKRVIATAGQTIDIDFASGDVMIDGGVIQEDYINDRTHDPEQFEGPKTVPEGYVFVMGDNRNASTDSRSSAVSLVDTRQILGKVLFVLIPGPNDDGSRTWSRIGSVYREQTKHA